MHIYTHYTLVIIHINCRLSCRLQLSKEEMRGHQDTQSVKTQEGRVGRAWGKKLLFAEM